MTIRYSFDTNILIYAADANTGKKHIRARTLLLESGRANKGCLLEQSLMEFLNACSRKTGISFGKAVEYVTDLLELFDVLQPQEDILKRTLQIISRYQLSVWDSRILATCSTHRCAVLFSEDMQDRGYYGDVRVLNPFHGNNDALVNEVFNS